MTTRLTPTQQELLDAMGRGVRVLSCWSRSTGHYYFRDDTMKTCTNTALALCKKGLVRNGGKFENAQLVRIENCPATTPEKEKGT